MSEARRYVKRPVECEALKINGFGDFHRAEKWITENGGKAQALTDRVTIITIDGNIADVFEGWYVVRGITGEFYPCRADIFEASHQALEAPETEEPDEPGLYRRDRKVRSQPRVAGAAKKVGFLGE